MKIEITLVNGAAYQIWAARRSPLDLLLEAREKGYIQLNINDMKDTFPHEISVTEEAMGVRIIPYHAILSFQPK